MAVEAGKPFGKTPRALDTTGMGKANVPLEQRTSVPLWVNLSFMLMWASAAASGFGDRVIMHSALTMLGGVGGNVDSTSISAAISFWFFLPYILFGTVAGWIADRLPRKWVMLASDEIRALVLLAAFLLVGDAVGSAFIPESHHWKVLAIMFGVGLMAGLYAPARNATIPQIVEPSQLQPANAVIISIAVIASMIGLGVSGAIIDPDDVSTIRFGLWLAFLLYAVSGTFYAFLKPRQHFRPPAPEPASVEARDDDTADHAAAATPPQVPGPRSRGFFDTLRYMNTHRRLVILILLNMGIWGAAMVIEKSVLSLCKLHYGFDEAGLTHKQILFSFTIMSMFLGFGLLAGAGVVAFINTRRESGLVIFTSFLVTGLCVLGLAVNTNYYVGCALAFGVGTAGNVAIVSVMAMLQSLSPNYIRGRVMGVNTVLSTLTNLLVNFAIWRLPDTDELMRPALYVLAVVLAAIAIAGLSTTLRSGPHATPMQNTYWRIVRLIMFVWHRLKHRGQHRVPKTGPVILAANHTTGIDPFAMQSPLQRRVRWVMLTSYRYGVLGFFWRAIDPSALDEGESNRGQIRAMVDLLDHGEVLGIFPEGGVQRDHRELKEFQPGTAMLVRRSHAVIVPVWISGTPVARHMFWHFAWPSRTTVIFGEPWKPDGSLSRQEILDELRRRMLALADEAESQGR